MKVTEKEVEKLGKDELTPEERARLRKEWARQDSWKVVREQVEAKSRYIKWFVSMGLFFWAVKEGLLDYLAAELFDRGGDKK